MSLQTISPEPTIITEEIIPTTTANTENKVLMSFGYLFFPIPLIFLDHSKLVSFHAKQSAINFGFYTAFHFFILLISWLGFSFFNFNLNFLSSLVYYIFAIWGVINVYFGREKELPLNKLWNKISKPIKLSPDMLDKLPKDDKNKNILVTALGFFGVIAMVMTSVQFSIYSIDKSMRDGSFDQFSSRVSTNNINNSSLKFMVDMLKVSNSGGVPSEATFFRTNSPADTVTKWSYFYKANGNVVVLNSGYLYGNGMEFKFNGLTWVLVNTNSITN